MKLLRVRTPAGAAALARLLLLGVPVSASVAQDSAPPSTWNASATSGVETYSGSTGASQTSWLWEDAGVRRLDGRNSYGLDGILARRFGNWDRAIAADVYAGITRGSYANVHAQVTPNARFLPNEDLSAEFFQSLDRGWEVSAGARRMQYAGTGSTIGTLGVARSIGSMYLRARVITLLAARSASSVALTARRYGKTADDFVEAGAGTGREVVSIGPAQQYDVRSTSSLYARGQRYVSRRVGFAATAAWTEEQRIPSRTGLYLSALWRW